MACPSAPTVSPLRRVWGLLTYRPLTRRAVVINQLALGLLFLAVGIVMQVELGHPLVAYILGAGQILLIPVRLRQFDDHGARTP